MTQSEAIRELNEIVTCLMDSGNTDLGIILGLVSTAILDGKQDEVYMSLCDLMPEYTDKELLEILLTNSMREN